MRPVTVLAIESDARQQALQLRRIAVVRCILVRRHTIDGGKQGFCWRHGYGGAAVADRAVDWHRKAVVAQATETSVTRQRWLLW